MARGRKTQHCAQSRTGRDAALAPTQRRTHAQAAVIHIRYHGSAPSPGASRFCVRHSLKRGRGLTHVSFVSFSLALIVPSIVVVGQTLQRGPRIASSVSLCLCGATGRSWGCSPNLIAGKIKGHANGSLRVTLLTPFLEPRSDRRVSLGRGACLALDSRLLQLCPR